MMQGADWKYISRIVEGLYVREEQIIPKDTVSGFQAAVKEFAAIAKEHARKKCEHTILTWRKNSLYALTKRENYGACDRIEVPLKKSGLPDKFLVGFDPKYIVDALNCCDEEEVDVSFSANAADKKIASVPLMLFRSGNFSSLLLPLRMMSSSAMAAFAEEMCA